MRAPFWAFIWPLFISLLSSEPAQAISSYVELGTGIGIVAGGNSFFGVSNAASTNMGFAGSVSYYVPIQLIKGFSQIDIGIQNRMYFTSTSSAPDHSLAMLTPNIAGRFQISRFYGGAGFSPLALMSITGPMALKPQSGKEGIFFEGGAIWRVVPELQIVGVFALEHELSNSPTCTEFGIHFRFPLNPNSSVGDASSKFDGFRYPFGFMK